LAISLAIAIPALAADGALNTSGAYLERNDQGQYDLAGRRQSLETVLRALAEMEGFELVAPGLPASLIERDYRGITAEQLLDRLTESLIVATEYVSGGQAPRRLKKVVVYANKGPGEFQAAQPTRQPGRGMSNDAGQPAVTPNRAQGMTTSAQQDSEDTPESALALAEALESTNDALRREAILALGKMRNEQAVQLLGQVLLGSPNVEDRYLAAGQLQRHPDPDAQTLLSAATEDSDPRIQALAAAAAETQR
jgi:hypothetical protein